MILAIDIGGTKTIVALMDNDATIVAQERFETSPDYSQFFDHLVQLIKDQFWQSDIRAIGLAAPGIIDEQTKIFSLFGNLPWHDVEVGASLERTFGVPVVVENDANVAGLYAITQLAPAPKFGLYLTIGTGIGTGIITNGRIDPVLAKSEGGHIMLNWKGEFHTWEDIASGRAIRRDFQKFAYEIQDQATWEEIAERLSLGLLALIPAMQPEVIVFGGGIGTHFDHFAPPLTSKLQQHLPRLAPMPTLAQAANPEEAVLYGCHQLATHHYPAS